MLRFILGLIVRGLFNRSRYSRYNNYSPRPFLGSGGFGYRQGPGYGRRIGGLGSGLLGGSLGGLLGFALGREAGENEGRNNFDPGNNSADWGNGGGFDSGSGGSDWGNSGGFDSGGGSDWGNDNSGSGDSW